MLENSINYRQIFYEFRVGKYFQSLCCGKMLFKIAILLAVTGVILCNTADGLFSCNLFFMSNSCTTNKYFLVFANYCFEKQNCYCSITTADSVVMLILSFLASSTAAFSS